MKKKIAGFSVMVFFALSVVCFAESHIPNLLGTWKVTAEGGVLVKGEPAGAKTHHQGEFSNLTAEAVVTQQQGRVVHGTFTSPRSTEKFVAIIGHNNKSFHYVDEDGFLEGRIVSKDKIRVVYRHTTANDVVVGVGTWRRQK